MFDIVMEKPGEVSRGDGCVWHSHWKTCWSQLKRCVLDIVMTNLVKSVEEVCAWNSLGKICWSQLKRRVLVHWLQQIFPSLSNISIALTDFSWFFHDYVKHTPLQLTSAGFSMTVIHTILQLN
jgi:hypothetical protein